MKYTLLLVILLAGTSASAQNPVYAQEEIVIGGIRQAVTMEGRDGTLPLLLFLHGGPGGSMMPYSHKFTDRLKEHFIVIQWDQRDTGKTLALNASPVPLTLELFQRDTYEMIAALLTRFKREKLYLAGHSWGTALGFYIAREHPELLYAYLPIGPMIDQAESERMVLSRMKEKASKRKNVAALEELGRVKIPFENGAQLYYHRRWLQDFAGSRVYLDKKYVERWAARWLPVFNEASKENLFLSLPSIACPVYFFCGRKDYQTNSALAERYYTQLTAPRKDFFWFDTGHAIPTSDPDRLQQRIIDIVLPETFVIQKPAALISTQ